MFDEPNSTITLKGITPDNTRSNITCFETLKK